MMRLPVEHVTCGKCECERGSIKELVSYRKVLFTEVVDY